MASAFDEAVCGLASLGVKSCIINGDDSQPRFDLFHFEWSICSWKVRCVLAEKRVPWTSWQLTAPLHNNYHPAYVQLRSLGNPGGHLVGEVFSGATAASSQGFDPLAVPTLLDRQKKKVVVDSKVICEYLERELPEPRLMPKEYDEVIAKHLSLVDETPPHGHVLWPASRRDSPGSCRQKVRGAHKRLPKKDSWRPSTNTSRIHPCLFTFALFTKQSARRPAWLS